ncbi:hypothetical protein PFDG_05204, partial [Plasmodium falciparum Dd2]
MSLMSSNKKVSRKKNHKEENRTQQNVYKEIENDHKNINENKISTIIPPLAGRQLMMEMEHSVKKTTGGRMHAASRAVRDWLNGRLPRSHHVSG